MLPKKILVIRLRAVGDVVLMTPLLRALRKQFPGAQIDLLADLVPSAVLQNNPRLSNLLVAPRRGAPLLEQLRFLRGVRASGYDWVLDLFGNPRSAWVSLLSGAPLRAGYAYRVRRWAYTHAVPMNRVRRYQPLVNLGVLEHLGVPSDGVDTEMFLTPQEREAARESLKKAGWDPGLGRPRIALNPSGTWSAKKWPVAHWRELAAELRRKFDALPLLLWGPGDEADVNRILEGMPGQVVVAPRTNLRELAALIGEMDLVIGNDGAPQHMAQALGVSTLTLFGPTWGLSWCRPSDARHRFLQHFPPCGPCDRTTCPNPTLPRSRGQAHKECLVKIVPSRVATVAMEMLDQA